MYNNQKPLGNFKEIESYEVLHILEYRGYEDSKVKEENKTDNPHCNKKVNGARNRNTERQ